MTIDPRAARLIAISFVSLFLELALIRFVNSTVQVIAYFNNFLILSAFLGLGFGSLLFRRRIHLFPHFPLILCAVVALMCVLDRFGTVPDMSDHIVWTQSTSGLNLPVPVMVVAVFIANFAFFVPLGYKIGECLSAFPNPLAAYAYELLGSILGVLAFTVTSYLRMLPWVWFAIGGLVSLLLIDRTSRAILPRGLLLGVGIILVALVPSHGIWSPYYKVSFIPYFLEVDDEGRFEQFGWKIMVDKLRIQDALRFGPALESTSLAPWSEYYRLPYHFREPGEVLILGGGAGNDAVFALEHGASRVDVIEIDPVIISMGYDLHPHTPYADPRVRTITDDARAFLRRTDETYDLIIMNALDSHHQLPGLSTLRLESFVYTVESFRDVQRLMHPGTIFIVHLSSSRPWMGERLYWSLTEAFGREPTLFSSQGSPFNSVAFVYGPPDALKNDLYPDKGALQEVSAEYFRTMEDQTILSTDDWPHLYLKEKSLPRIYIGVLLAIVLFTFASFRTVGSFGSFRGFLQYMFMGAGFMLLETRSITQLALLFGATWLVNAIVIGSILLLVLLGNLLVLKGFALPRKVAFPILFALLIAGYFVDMSFILAFPMFWRLLAAGIWISLPILFASLIFSSMFAQARDTATAFGANLLGIVIGGSLEYTSMILGLSALYFIALGLYVCAMLADLLAPRVDPD